MPNIEIYSKGYCPFCSMSKRTFEQLNLGFREIDITNNLSKAKEMYLRTHRRTVPQIFINGFHIGGNDDLQDALKNGLLKKLLTSSS